MIPRARWPALLTAAHQLAERAPEAPAVHGPGGQRVTRAELLARAEAIAARLATCGAGPGGRVVLELERSPRFVAAMLGAWMVGAAWSPLPPSAPARRRAEAAARLGATARVGPDQITPIEGAAPAPPIEDLAYVIFTSGSSGRPKGVAVTHRGLAPVLRAQIEAFGITERSRTLWALDPAFDASLSDIGVALMAGAQLVILGPEQLRQGPAGLMCVLGERGVTHADLPPWMLGVIDPQLAPGALECVIMGGEVCPLEAARRWAQRVRLINVYGPTEATICTSMARVPPDPSWDAPYLGAPIEGVTYRCEPADERGLARLLIGGAHLAAGYLEEGLTAERFVGRDGARWFDTRDLVRVHPDGRLSFVGRLDRQLKVRGQLVAPEEVEAALTSHPRVARAVVSHDEARDRLDARVELAPGCLAGEATPERLRAHLAERLPGYMIPSRVELAALATTSSGKIDVATTAREALLCAVWARALGLEEVGPTQRFDALGGTSLQAVEILGRAAAAGLEGLDGAMFTAGVTPRRLARALEVGEDPHARAASLREAPARVRSSAPAAAPVVTSRPPCLLVTGATGFVGSRLARELLARQPELRLICLVRAGGEAHATRRIEEALGQWGRMPEGWTDRVEACVGDISRPRMGLGEEAYERLCARITGVVHGAARVHLLASFELLYAANVEGTRQALALAGRAGAPLHYISTLSVLANTDAASGALGERMRLDDPALTRVWGGYAQTKYAAEWCVWRDGPELEVPASVYRLGLVTRDARLGVSARRDWLDLFWRGLDRLGAAPDESWLEGRALDISPVDEVAPRLAQLILRAPGGGRARPEVFHLAAPEPTLAAAVVGALERARGAPLPRLARPELAAKLGRSGAGPAAVALAAVVARGRRPLDLFLASGCIFRCDRARAQVGSWWAPADGEMLEAYARAALELRGAR